MRLIGFNFTKLSSEKFKNIEDDLNVNNNLELTSMNKVDLGNIRSDEEIISFGFTYTLNYEPNIAKIEILGKTVISMDPQTAQEVIDKWDSKEIPPTLKSFIFNIILRKTTIRALQFEEDLGLPTHVPMPRVRSTLKDGQDDQEIETQQTQDQESLQESEGSEDESNSEEN